MSRQFHLDYHPGMMAMTTADRAAYLGSHGCGPGSGPGDWLVPDRLLGLSIKPACGGHDWEYEHTASWEARKQADKRLLDNMVAIVLNRGGWLKTPRMWLAWRYYQAVRTFGGPFYAKGKGEIK